MRSELWRLSRLISFHQFIDFSIRSERIESDKKNSSSEFTVIQLVVSHQIENCELYEIKLSILKAANRKAHQIMLFLNHSRRCFLKFLTQIEYESRRKISSAKITIIVIFQVSKFSNAKITIIVFLQVDTNTSSMLQTHNFVISWNFDA